ncbi:MAG TPA: hypothetical protein VGK00_05895 [Anaerolineales bacterium]|jgi:4-amino-4-deoxy-L-arabinose transferase-like glycosyltransferase
MMNKRAVLILALIASLSITLGFFSLTRGQSWGGDDFASYVLQAKSILSGKMGDFIQENAFTIEHSSRPPGPVAYPWGYPLLLAPVYAVFGLHALALKLVNLGLYALFLVSMYFLGRSRLGELESLLLTGFFAFAPAMLAATDLILSDVAFLAFSTLSLVLIERLPGGKAPLGVASGTAIFMAFFMRVNGVLLLAPLSLTLLGADWPRWQVSLKKAWPALLTFAGLVSLQYGLFPGGQSSYFEHFSMLTPQRLLDNTVYYLRLPGRVFDQIPGGAALYPLLAVFLLISLSAHARRDAAMHIYGLLSMLLFIAWPERQDLRFIYPVLPFFFVAAMDGMGVAAGWLPARGRKVWVNVARGFWGTLLVLSLGISTVSAWQITSGGRAINGPFDESSAEMFAFIRAETPAESIVIFRKPRALRLFTGRNAFMTENCGDLPGGDYVVIHLKAENGQVPAEQVSTCNPVIRLDEVFRNKRFVVYQVRR